jgi:hypothetical protein
MVNIPAWGKELKATEDILNRMAAKGSEGKGVNK